MNDRGQALAEGLPWLAAILVVAGAGVVVFDRLDAELATAQHNPVQLCNGMWGCGPAPAWWWALLGVAILAVLAVFLAISIVERRETTSEP